MGKRGIGLCAAAAWAALMTAPAMAGEVTRITEPSAFHGVHGIRFGPGDVLLAGSVAGQSLYKVDVEKGTAEVLVGPPQGTADDMAFGPGGQVVWTAISDNIVWSRVGDGPITKLDPNLVSVNAITFSRDGKRLFASQVFGGDALWELDPKGETPRRLIAKDMGGFNSFAHGPDGWLYGPVWFKGQVAKINPDTGEMVVVAEGLNTPASVKFDSRDNLYVIDSATGEVLRVDRTSGAKTRIAQLSTSLDNFAIDSKDRMFVSNMADNGIQEVDIATGEVRQVMRGPLAFPADVAVRPAEGGEEVVVADVFALRAVDGRSGAVRDLRRVHAKGEPLEYPTGVSIGAGGRAVLASSATGAVMIDEAGQPLKVLHGFKAPSDALELADGSLLVAEIASGDLVKVEGDKRTVLAGGFVVPGGLAAGADGQVYVAETGAGKITQVDLASGAKTTVAEGLKLPKAVAVDAGGGLVVLETGAKAVVAIDPKSGARTVIAEDLPVGQVTTPFPLAGGLAIGPSGAIYVTGDVENAIYRITR
jgi:sugar lactone lactonase YvrE